MIVVETRIAASPAAVFAIVAGFADWPTHLPTVMRVEMSTDGPVAVGTRFRQTRRVYGRESSEDMTVAVLDPPRRVVLTAENHGMRYESIHEIEPADGGALLRMRFGGVASGIFARLMAPLMAIFIPGMRRALEADLAAIKAAAEASP